MTGMADLLRELLAKNCLPSQGLSASLGIGNICKQKYYIIYICNASYLHLRTGFNLSLPL